MSDRRDGNTVDLSGAETFRKREAVRAFQLRDPVTFTKKWGSQEMVAGDWVTIDGTGTARGCKADSFVATYVLVPGTMETYRKLELIRAMKMTEEFQVVTKDSAEPAMGEAGDWLVQNGENVQDRYLIKAEKFSDLYELKTI